MASFERNPIHSQSTSRGRRLGPWLLSAAFLLCSLVGAHYYKKHRIEATLARAAEHYQALMTALQDNKSDIIQEKAKLLMQAFSETPYGTAAAFISARQACEDNNLAQAETHLQWALDKSQKGPLQHLARARLARILLMQNKLELAQNLLRASNPEGFETLYQDIRGDIFARHANYAEARTAYTSALQHLPLGSQAPWIETKLNNLNPKERPL